MKNVTGAFLESKYRRAIAAGDDDAITQTRDELIIFLRHELAEAQRELVELKVLLKIDF
jgi:hypothetical protein